MANSIHENHTPGPGTSSSSTSGGVTTGDPGSPFAAHTPGPWCSDSEHQNTIEIRHDHKNNHAVGEEVCSLYCERGPVTPLMKANARLIAAAPDLLAALKIARDCIAYCRRAHKDAQSGEGFPVEIILDAAIAKATGAV